MRLILLVALCCVFYLATAAPQSSSGKQSSSGGKPSSSGSKQGSSDGLSGGGKGSSSGGKGLSSGGKGSSSGGKRMSSGGNSTSSGGNSKLDDKSSTDMESAPYYNSIFPVVTKWLLALLRQFMPTVYATLRFFWNWTVAAGAKLIDLFFPNSILKLIL